MLSDKLKNKNIILASGSPRRQELFKELGLDFCIQVKAVEEIYPQTLKGAEITNYLAELKAAAFTDLADAIPLATKRIGPTRSASVPLTPSL